MPYTIQINKLGATPPDDVTPLNLSDPNVTRVQENDRIVITIPDGTDFGTFDPGEVVGLNNVPYILLSTSMKSSLVTFSAGTIRILGPAASGAAVATRKQFVLLSDVSTGGIFISSVLILRDHLVGFDSPDAGPYTFITTLEPMRNVDLVSAYAQSRRA